MERNVPKLRFNGFNDEWKKSTFKELTKKVGPKNKNNEEFKVYSISNKYGFIPQDEQFENSRLDNLDKSAYKVVRKGDFAYNPARINVGSIGLLEEESGIVSSLYVCFRFAENLNNQFFKEYFSTYKFNKDVLRNVEGGVRDYLFYENFIRLKVNVPSKEEQERIANFLTKVDKIIEKQEEKVKNLENYKKGMMQKIFSQEIRFKDENGEEYPEWEEKKLGELGVFFRGHSYNSNDVIDEGLLVLRSNNINNNKINYDDLQFVKKKCNDNIKLKDKDIIICMANGSKKLVGKAGEFIENYRYEQITVGAFCSIYRTNNNIAKYLFQLKEYQKYLCILLAGTNINNLKNSDLEELIFKIPSSSKEVVKIDKILSNINSIIDKENNKLEKLKQWKKGLLQQMFV